MCRGSEGAGFDCKGLVNLGCFVALACSYPRETAYIQNSAMYVVG